MRLVLSSDGAFNDEQTRDGKAGVSAKCVDETVKERQTAMSRHMMSRVDKHPQHVDCQLVN